MNLPLLVALVLGVALLTLGQYLSQRAERRHALTLGALQSHTLQRCLELLQALQKHRGLGAQQDIVSVSLRNTLARQLDELWLNWPGASLQLPALQQHWPLLRRKPADFEAHSRLIDALLEVIEQLEERLHQQAHPAIRGLGEACRALEDLARLRGLAVRAANYSRCPPGLQEQMRALCTRLDERALDQPLQALLERLRQELIEAPQVRLAPADCFALLTPLIEQRVQGIRLNLV